MEEFHHQLLNKLSTSTTFYQKTTSRSSNVDNDVFGSPLGFQVSSFPSLIDDYSEMFSSFHALRSSASVPVLHFRLFDCNDISVDVLSSNFNYAEVFGGFDGVDFANYEEIIAENLSNGPRTSAEMDCTKQASTFISGTPEGHNGDPFNCSEENDILSNEIFHLTCDDVGQLLVPLNMANGKSKGDSIDGTSPTAQFHEVSVSDFVVDACAPSKEINYGRHPPQVANDLNLSEESNRGIAKGEYFRETLSNATVCSSITKISGNDLEADMEQLGDNYTTLGDVPASDQNCGHYLYNRSSSKVFLTVSDINLQTRPCQVPPPSRPPPNLVTKQNDFKGIIIADAKAYPGKVHLCKGSPIDQTCLIGMASEKHAVEEAAKESSPPFLDVEIDSGSAAMKEAMENAQTRLKSAKESIERKQDNAKSLVKLGLNEHKIGQERKVGATAPHDYKYMEDITLETCEREKCKMKYFAADERQMTIGAVHGALNSEEKWGYIELATDSMVKRHGKECRTMLECCKQEWSGGDWEAEKPFYELVKDEKFKVAQDFPVRDHKQKLAEITEAHGEELNKKKVAEQVCVPEKNGRSRVVQESHGWEENVEELKEAQKLEENIKQPVTDLVACESKENKKKAEVAYEQEEKESRAAKRFCKCEEDDQIFKAAKVTSERQVKKKIEDVQMAYKMEENEKEMRAAEEACQFALNEKELKATKEPFEQDKIKKISEIASVKVRSGAYENVCDVNVKLKAARDASSYEENKKAMKAAKDASKYEGCEMTMKPAKKVWECDDDDKKFKEVASKQSGNSETLKKTEDFCHWEENKKKLEAADGARGCKKSEEKMEMSGAVLVQDTYDEILGVVQEACGWENNKNELKVSQKSAEVTTENHLETADTTCEIGGNQKNIRDDLEALDQFFFKTKFKAAQEIFRWLEVGKKSEAARWEKVLEGVHILGTAPEVMLNQGKEKKEESGYVMNEIEEKKNEKGLLTKSEMHKEQVSKFGEEREEEHKRVKDRIPVETHVIHDGAFAEVRERAERIHMESMTAEAQPRAMEYNQGSAEMVSANAHKKFLAEKAFVQSTLRAGHEAMARADSEAQKRAAENSLLDNLGASGWVERSVAEKFTARKDNGIECIGDEMDFGIKQSSSSSVNDVQNFVYDPETCSVNSSSINSPKYSKSEDWSASHSDVKFQGADGESAERCKARLARHQRMLERMAKALAEKNLRDILAQRELAERNRLAEALDADVRRWSKGKEGNLRALLSTLQYILGPESGWQPIPLTDVITAVAVKKAYKKAALYVHPDKVQQRRASNQQKYICEKVYDLLKEAWNKFNSEEP